MISKLGKKPLFQNSKSIQKTRYKIQYTSHNIRQAEIDTKINFTYGRAVSKTKAITEKETRF